VADNRVLDFLTASDRFYDGHENSFVVNLDEHPRMKWVMLRYGEGMRDLLGTRNSTVVTQNILTGLRNDIENIRGLFLIYRYVRARKAAW